MGKRANRNKEYVAAAIALASLFALRDVRQAVLHLNVAKPDTSPAAFDKYRAVLLHEPALNELERARASLACFGLETRGSLEVLASRLGLRVMMLS